MGRQMLRPDSGEGHRKGYHTREHRLNQPEVLGFLSQLDKVEALELEGCSDWPHLRFCYGCNDVFARIVSIKYTNLTKLRIVCAFISGSRFRRFIKKIASTLTKIECIGIILTDGSWRSVAQGLLKVPGLEELMFWGHLYQKRMVPSTKQVPLEWQSNETEVIVVHVGTEIIRKFLQHFIAYFATIPYDAPREEAWVPQYHRVRLFPAPGLLEGTHETWAWSKLRTYAEEVCEE
jgi:hypothetical protein